MPYMVKEVAEIAGISVRTLHYYDQIDLLKPASLNSAGYRLYQEADLEKLQEILFFKELDFSLEEIKEILKSPGYDRKETFIAHKKLLLQKKERLDKMIKSLEQTIHSIERGIQMNKKEMFDSFDMTEVEKYKKQYADEVRKKYDPNVVAESERKTANYSRDDWAQIMEKGNRIYKRLAVVMDQGPTSSETQALIAEFRQYITDHFYNCTLEIFRGLGELYVTDERFTKNIDKFGTGLAEFMQNAMQIYCDQQEENQ